MISNGIFSQRVHDLTWSWILDLISTSKMIWDGNDFDAKSAAQVKMIIGHNR